MPVQGGFYQHAVTVLGQDVRLYRSATRHVAMINPPRAISKAASSLSWMFIRFPLSVPGYRV